MAAVPLQAMVAGANNPKPERPKPMATMTALELADLFEQLKWDHDAGATRLQLYQGSQTLSCFDYVLQVRGYLTYRIVAEWELAAVVESVEVWDSRGQVVATAWRDRAMIRQLVQTVHAMADERVAG